MQYRYSKILFFNFYFSAKLISKFQKIKFNEKEFDIDLIIEKTENYKKIHKEEIENFFIKKDSQIKKIIFYLKFFSFKFLGWKFNEEDFCNFIYFKENKNFVKKNFEENKLFLSTSKLNNKKCSSFGFVFSFGYRYCNCLNRFYFGKKITDLILNFRNIFYKFCGFSVKRKALVFFVLFFVSYLVLILSRRLFLFFYPGLSLKKN